MPILSGRFRGTRLGPRGAKINVSKGFVREVLFNWLMADLDGANALDCFAGSGALGIEAVSRGASHAELWEKDPKLCRSLRADCARLAPESLCVHRHDAYRAAPPPGHACGLVFLDPPFDHRLDGLSGLLDRLGRCGRLSEGAKIYLEQRQHPGDFCDNLHQLRSRRCGDVHISLWSWRSGQSQP